MKQIADDVYVTEGLRVTNVYLLVSDDGLTLVDAGTAGDVGRIVAQIEEAGFDPSDLRSILVTHAHADHIGGLPALVQRYGAEVIAHRAEVPYIEGTASLPVTSALLRAMAWLGNLLPGESSGVEVARGLEDGEVLDLLGGLRVIHTPGHTPGSMCLYQEQRGILFCGDLLTNGHVITRRGGLRYAPRVASTDNDEVKRSVHKLAGLQVSLLCVAHGAPILGEASAQIEALLGAG